MIKNILLTISLIVGFSACESKKMLPLASTFPDSIEVIADELQKDIKFYTNETIVFTSLVDLNDLKESSNFGRLFSESLMTQLSRRGYKVMEYRGDEIVTKSKKGEFKLNRARIQSIKNKDILVLVGTYSEIDENMIVNVRIVNKETNILVAAASAYIPSNEAKETTIIEDRDKFIVQLVPSSCSEDEYCWKDLDE